MKRLVVCHNGEIRLHIIVLMILCILQIHSLHLCLHLWILLVNVLCILCIGLVVLRELLYLCLIHLLRTPWVRRLSIVPFVRVSKVFVCRFLITVRILIIIWLILLQPWCCRRRARRPCVLQNKIY